MIMDLKLLFNHSVGNSTTERKKDRTMFCPYNLGDPERVALRTNRTDRMSVPPLLVLSCSEGGVLFLSGDF